MTVDNVERRRAPEAPTDPVSPTPPRIKPARELERVPAASDRHIDGDLAAFVGAQKANDRILYVGMNKESATTEAAGLRATGANVTTVMNRYEKEITLDGRKFDLT